MGNNGKTIAYIASINHSDRNKLFLTEGSDILIITLMNDLADRIILEVRTRNARRLVTIMEWETVARLLKCSERVAADWKPSTPANSLQFSSDKIKWGNWK